MLVTAVAVEYQNAADGIPLKKKPRSQSGLFYASLPINFSMPSLSAWMSHAIASVRRATVFLLTVL